MPGSQRLHRQPDHLILRAVRYNASVKCPHCTVGIHESFIVATALDPDADSDHWRIMQMTCSECGRLILRLDHLDSDAKEWVQELVRPRGVTRAPLSLDVREKYAGDYREACLVLADSPKASAALSRRCLQNLLRDEAGVKQGTLSREIAQAMKSLPSHLSSAIDGVRNIGNFAAHPEKSTKTGEIIDVEPGEAEWLLDTLEGLFDFYFVQPELLKRKRGKLNEKLKDAGKPEMK